LGGVGAKTSYTFKYILNADEEKHIMAAKDALDKTNTKLVDELTPIKTQSDNCFLIGFFVIIKSIIRSLREI